MFLSGYCVDPETAELLDEALELLLLEEELDELLLELEDDELELEDEDELELDELCELAPVGMTIA